MIPEWGVSMKIQSAARLFFIDGFRSLARSAQTHLPSIKNPGKSRGLIFIAEEEGVCNPIYFTVSQLFTSSVNSSPPIFHPIKTSIQFVRLHEDTKFEHAILNFAL